MAVLAAALLGLSALTAGDGERSAAPAGQPAAQRERPLPVNVIAGRVESIRGLSFDTIPSPVAVTPEQAQREGLEDLDRSYPAERRRVDEEVLKLLKLIPPEITLREVSAETFSQGVAGYYDPRTKRLRTVKGAATGTRVLAEMVLAHELTHALEDQRYKLDLEDTSGSDDGTLARLSLVEGSATALMYRYVDEHFTPEETLSGVLGSAFADTGSLPPFLQAQLTFPYVGGQVFVEELLERAGGRWTLVDLAERSRPPASTEQVMHPQAYLEVDVPKPVRLRLRTLVGRDYKRVVTGTSGELQTREMLATAGGGGSADAAEGWGGDRYELWQPRGLGNCDAPCRTADVLALRWVWDTPGDEKEFATKLRQWVGDGLGAKPGAGTGDGWTLDGGAVAVARRGGAVTLALAPDQGLARRVARSR
jgi:hypothetical protein